MRNASRIVGWVLVACGAACVFVGASPLFEVQLEAYLLGVGLFGAGAWVLAGRDLRETIRRGIHAARDARRLSRVPRASGRGTRSAGTPALTDRLLPVRILKLAQEHGGLLTVARVAMELNVPLDQAYAGLEECARSGHAVPDYDIGRGHELYRFPEFTAPETPRLSD